MQAAARARRPAPQRLPARGLHRPQTIPVCMFQSVAQTECVSHREIGAFCEPVVAQVCAGHSSSPTLPPLESRKTSKPLCDRLFIHSCPAVAPHGSAAFRASVSPGGGCCGSGQLGRCRHRPVSREESVTSDHTETTAALVTERSHSPHRERSPSRRSERVGGSSSTASLGTQIGSLCAPAVDRIWLMGRAGVVTVACRRGTGQWLCRCGVAWCRRSWRR